MADMIDLSQAVLGTSDCPDVRNWPIGAGNFSVEFASSERFERGDTMLEFDGRDQLPDAFGSQGAIRYTMWIGCKIAGAWHIAAAVECRDGYIPTGPLLASGQIGINILYYANAPLRGYQPAPRESIAVFCTTGDTRRQNVQAVQRPWRTSVLVVPLSAG